MEYPYWAEETLMDDMRESEAVSSAVLFGPGGPLGTAWTLGLLAGLRQAGVDLATADLIVGTSAGAIAGAALASGRDLNALAVLPASSGSGASNRSPGPDPSRMAEVFGVLQDSAMSPEAKLQQVGQLALAAPTMDEATYVARMEFLIGSSPEWPKQRLLIPAVDVLTGEPVVWDRDSGVPLARAVASSTAFPATAPPITLGNRRYMDGALRAGINADLVDSPDVLVIVEPMAHLFGATSLDDVPAQKAISIVADAASQQAFGPDLADRSRWTPAFESGHRQSTQAATQISQLWTR